MSKAPSPPDPAATAAAQTQSNQQTAAYNAALNRVSTYTPYGNLIYSQTGTDSTGAPTYRADVSLTPTTQAQLDNQQKQNLAISQLGNQLTGQIGQSIGNPLTGDALSGQNAANSYYAQEHAYLDPTQANQQSDLSARLANQGINMMSSPDAWNRAQGELSRNQTFQNQQVLDSSVLHGQQAQQQAIQNQTAVINQPYNELASLRSGTAIQNPTFQNAPSANANGTDVAGIINNAYNQQVSQANNTMNGLFSLGAAAISLSDRRLKQEIKRVGTHRRGFGVYEFSYNGSDTRYRGVMAQEVARVMPSAIIVNDSGYMAVDYRAIG